MILLTILIFTLALICACLLSYRYGFIDGCEYTKENSIHNPKWVDKKLNEILLTEEEKRKSKELSKEKQ